MVRPVGVIALLLFEQLGSEFEQAVRRVYQGERAWEFWRWPFSVRWNRLFTIVR